MKRFFCLLSFLILSIVLMVGCSESVKKENKKVTLIEFSWESIKIHNEIAKYILEGAYDYKVETVVAESAPGLLGLEQGDAHIAMEVWMDNRGDWWEKVKDTSVVSVGSTFVGEVRQGWFIPSYMEDSITSLEDLMNYLVSNKKMIPLISAPSGWGTYKITKLRYEGYELQDVLEFVDPGSSSGLDIEIQSFYEKELPFVCYYWEPTALLGKLDMRLLKESAYDSNLWKESSNYLCTYPDPKVYKLVNKEFYVSNKDSNIIKFVEKYNISTIGTNKLLTNIKSSGKTYEEYVKGWMKTSDHWYYLVDNDKELIRKVLEYVNSN